MPADAASGLSRISFTFNGKALSAPQGCSVAAALLSNGIVSFRSSVSGEPRAPLCGMGTCYECRLTINGRRHQKSCQSLLTPGMAVAADD